MNRCVTMKKIMDSEEQAIALKRAEELQTNLSSKHPSFIKQMKRSNVTTYTALILPLEFCKFHLPEHDAAVTLEDTSGQSYEVKFHPRKKKRFHGGWNGFLAAQKLVEGDVLVFHLVKPCYFKVYIIRAVDTNVVGHPNLTCFYVHHANEDEKEGKCDVADRKRCRLVPDLGTVQESVKRSSMPSNPSLELCPDHPCMEEFHSSDMEVSLLSEHAAYSQVHKHPDSVEVQTWEEKEASFDSGNEQDSSDSSCMAMQKPPSIKINIPSFSKQVSSLSSKKANKQVVFDNRKTMKRCVTKKRRMDSEEQALALKRAEELQKNLSSEHPSFIKQMQRSNVTTYTELILPLEFCKFHLPEHDADVTLEDESGESYEVKFHPRIKKRFHSGWNVFLAAHKLVECDVLVFHLLKPCYFKVYIVRVNDPQLDTIEERGIGSNHSNKEEEFQSSSLKVCTLSGLDADFDKFKVTVNGDIIDPQLSTSTRFNYYKLCCSQKSFLHEHLLKNVNSSLAAEIIKGTLQVADAIRASKLTTSKENFALWDNTLEGFKTLGMDVGFLRDRLKGLVSFESEKVKMYVEAKNKMKSIKRKLLDLEQDAQKLEDVMKMMKVDIVKCKDTFLEKANAPW